MTKSNAQRQSEWRARRRLELASLRASTNTPLATSIVTGNAITDHNSITDLSNHEFEELNKILVRIRSQKLHAEMMQKKEDEIKELLKNLVT